MESLCVFCVSFRGPLGVCTCLCAFRSVSDCVCCFPSEVRGSSGAAGSAAAGTRETQLRRESSNKEKERSKHKKWSGWGCSGWFLGSGILLKKTRLSQFGPLVLCDDEDDDYDDDDGDDD